MRLGSLPALPEHLGGSTPTPHTWAVGVADQQRLRSAAREAAVERLDGGGGLVDALHLHQRPAAFVQLCAGEAAGGEGAGKLVRCTGRVERFPSCQLAQYQEVPDAQRGSRSPAHGAPPLGSSSSGRLTGGSPVRCQTAQTSRRCLAACSWLASCDSSCRTQGHTVQAFLGC